MLAFEDKRRLVRVVRKLLRPGGRFGLTFERRITVFVRHENVLRLLEFLGYYLE
jgi:hypothetical protein